MRAKSAALAILMIIVVSLISAAIPASAQRQGSLELVTQVVSIRPGRPFSLSVLMQGGSRDHLVSATVHSRVGSRSQFQLQLNGLAEFSAPIYSFAPTPVKTIRTGKTELITLEFTTTDDPAEQADILLTAEGGVFPVLVRLADANGNQQDELLTYLVVTPKPVDEFEPLRVNVTLPVQAPPALQPDQSSSIDPASLSKIEAILEVVAGRPSMNITLAVVPETLVALKRDVDTRLLVEQLEIAVARRELLRLPYVNVSESAWNKTSQIEGYERLLEAGDRVLKGEVDARSIGTAAFLDIDATPTIVGMLGDLGYEQIIVADRQLKVLPGDLFPFTVTQQFIVRDQRGQRHPAAVIDTALGAHFGANENPILDAHNFIADLAILWFDQPTVARGVIVRPSAGWDADPQVLRIALSGITSMRVLRAVDLNTFFGEVATLNASGQVSPTGESRRAIMVRNLNPPGPTEQIAAFATQLGQAESLLSSYEEILGGQTRDTAPLSELLLVSGARGIEQNRRLEYLDSIDEAVTMAIRSIEGPEPQVVSITAREASIPIFIENGLSTPAAVVLRFSSDKLEFPEGQRLRVTLEPGSNEFSFPIKSRSSGDAKLRVTVLSPDEAIQLDGPDQIIVRSTVFSGLGLLILVGALVILALWWLRQILEKRRETTYPG